MSWWPVGTRGVIIFIFPFQGGIGGHLLGSGRIGQNKSGTRSGRFWKKNQGCGRLKKNQGSGRALLIYVFLNQYTFSAILLQAWVLSERLNNFNSLRSPNCLLYLSLFIVISYQKGQNCKARNALHGFLSIFSIFIVVPYQKVSILGSLGSPYIYALSV